jgi:hypothetical protein
VVRCGVSSKVLSKVLSEGHVCPSVHPLYVLVLEVWVRVLSYMSMTMGMCLCVLVLLISVTEGSVLLSVCVVSTSLLSVCFFIFSSSGMCLCVISSTSSIYMNGIYSEGGGSL